MGSSSGVFEILLEISLGFAFFIIIYFFPCLVLKPVLRENCFPKKIVFQIRSLNVELKVSGRGMQFWKPAHICLWQG